MTVERHRDCRFVTTFGVCTSMNSKGVVCSEFVLDALARAQSRRQARAPPARLA